MKFKKIFCILLMLIAIVAICAGCGEIGGDDGGYDSDNEQSGTPSLWFQPTYSGTMYVGTSYWLGYDMNYGYLDDVEYTILSNSAGATINTENWTITASKAGTARIRISGYYDEQLLSAEGTMTFNSPELKLVMDSDTNKIGDPVQLKYTLSPDNIYAINNDLITYEIVSGNAAISMNDGYYYIVAREAGEVKIKLTYKNEEEGLELEEIETLTFVERNFNISTDFTCNNSFYKC